jgi:hypothetical protein
MSNYNTNLASEFYVLSTLHRLGVDASLTLGNKKAVDIFVIQSNGNTVTVDVKGVSGQYDWPADNIELPGKENHIFVLVSYNGKITDPEQPPSVWIIPSLEIKSYIKTYKTRKVVSRALVRNEGTKYRHAWRPIIGKVPS